MTKICVNCDETFLGFEQSVSQMNKMNVFAN